MSDELLYAACGHGSTPTVLEVAYVPLLQTCDPYGIDAMRCCKAKLRNKRYIIGIILSLAFLTSISFSQRTIRVPNDHPTIQLAIDSAKSGELILVSEGTYKENLVINKKITLASHYYLDNDTSHISKTIIDGSSPANPDSGSVILLATGTDTTTIISGFTITKGKGTKLPFYDKDHVGRLGGGICIPSGGGGKIIHNTISNNVVDTPVGYWIGGAGIAAWPQDMVPRTNWVIVEDNRIENNRVYSSFDSTEGAGLAIISMSCRIARNSICNNFLGYISNAGGVGGGMIAGSVTALGGNDTIIITHNTFSENYSRFGGGLHLFGDAARLTLQKNTITANSAGVSGGGLVLSDNLKGAIVTDNYISRNVSSIGGGIRTFSLIHEVILSNNIIADNTASSSGGGMRSNGSSRINLINCTVAFNSAPQGSSLYVSSSTFRCLNTILWDTFGSTIAYSTGGSVVASHSFITGGFTGTRILSDNPRFVSNDSTYRLDNSSTCIGGGSISATLNGVLLSAPLKDFAGQIRPSPAGSPPDIGALEHPLDKAVTSVEDLQNAVPKEFSLEQNYPNPFNPLTNVEFRLPIGGMVRLSVYDLLGREVAVLVNEEKSAGIYKITWNASGFSSGIYFYRIQANGHSAVKTMILVR